MSNVQTISIGTFNTWGIPFSSHLARERYQALCQSIEHSSLDLLHLQEVWFYYLLDILRTRLPSYHLAYRRGLFGPEAGLVTLSRQPLQNIEFINFPPVGAPPEKRWWKRATQPLKRKGALLACLPQWSLATCNCHLIANKADDWSQASRYYRAHEYALERLADIVNSLAQQRRHILIMGDFNIPKQSELYQKFVQLSQATDLFEQDDSPTYHKEFWPNPQRLDYVFFQMEEKREQLHVRHKDFLFQEKVRLQNGKDHYLSDHIGLMAELEIDNI
ncbi:endonuclease/exonuclease/phosphatase family protein [Ktedonosporobacter rubrisoli]|uniref:Endonuclease/exonuclease/phosphatase family protein n=1 Tax=Ktedonosporobacter rubrisoli TaxID=2509675 RepID=A0A4P6K2C3_KTERU|nr:endonuclease/exonuclease/phosphatase family protein [Ktedonosporobacter rubrisoli]QBD82357.1 endonuclease/exonuclease/phosphatase family protein [Ktedonosporobacter rubrisoli]